MYQTTLSSWALLLAKAIDHQGIDSGAVFRKAGLDPSKLSDPNYRYASVGMKKLWAVAAEVTGDACIGLKAASYWHPTTLHALGFSWMASASLHDALQRMVRYLDIVSTATRLKMDAGDDEVVVEFTFDAAYVPAVEAMDAALAVLVDMCRGSYGEDFALNQVFLGRNAPDCEQEFRHFFQAPVKFSASRNAIAFDRACLDKPLPTANPELVRANDAIVAEHLAELNKNDIVGQVKIEIIHLLSSGSVSERLIANRLNMSLRSLQRKLAGARSSYFALLEDTRRELAIQYMRDSRHSVNEVTYLLGFSEPSNFSRAFKRWTGFTPSQFREQ